MTMTSRLAWVTSAAALIVVGACSTSRPGAGGGTGTPIGPGPGPVTQDAGVDSGSTNCPPPPYACDDAGTTNPTSKPGSSGPTPGKPKGPGTCNDGDLAFTSSSLHASGPTSGFANMYNAALPATQPGPFAVRLVNFDSTNAADFSVSVGSAKASGPTEFQLLEVGGHFPVTLAGQALTVPATAASFHIAFTTSGDPLGDLVAGGFSMSATLDSGCGSLTNVTATLYIPSSEGGVTLTSGGATIGSQLGAPTANVGGLGFTGWAVPISGLDSLQVPTQ